MMRVLLAVAAVTVATPTLAQTETETTKTQFITMGPENIKGGGVKVPIAYMSARGKVKFERMLKLKHDVLPKMKATAKDVTLR